MSKDAKRVDAARLAWLAFEARDIKAAKQHLSDASIDLEQGPVLHLRALLAMYEGQTDHAEELFQRLVEIEEVPVAERTARISELVLAERKDQEFNMSNINSSLESILQLDGAIAAALVDWESGLTLGTIGGSNTFDIELASSGNTAVVRAKTQVMRQLGLHGNIEDILITLDTQYHLIRLLQSAPSLFLYVAIDRAKGNLGLARHKLRTVEENLSL